MKIVYKSCEKIIVKEMLIKALPSPPSYEEMSNYEKLGRYIGGFYDRWEWDSFELLKLTCEEICNLYNKLHAYSSINSRVIQVEEIKENNLMR